MLKIAFISNTFPPYPCGVGDYTFNLINALLKKENVVIDIYTPNFINNLPNPLLKTPINFSKWKLKSIFQMINILKKENTHIVHIQNTSTRNIFYYLIPLFLRVFSKTTIIITIHEHNTKTILGKIANIVSLLFSDHFVIQEREYADTFRSYFFLKHKKITFMPTPSNIPQSKLSEKEAQKLRVTYTKKHEVIIAYFGFLVEHKGVLKIFEACDPSRDFILLISNFETFASEYSEKVRLTISSEKWRDSSFCTGFISAEQVADLLFIADICIFPFTDGKKSRNASFSAARLQGTFCITTHERIRGYEKSEHTYYTSTTDNIEEIKAGIDFYLKECKGKKVVNDNITWDMLANKYCEIYTLYSI